MTEEKGDYILSRGQPPLAKKYGEETTSYKFVLPVSQLEHLKTEAEKAGIPVAEYIRRLIAENIRKKGELDSDL